MPHKTQLQHPKFPMIQKRRKKHSWSSPLSTLARSGFRLSNLMRSNLTPRLNKSRSRSLRWLPHLVILRNLKLKVYMLVKLRKSICRSWMILTCTRQPFLMTLMRLRRSLISTTKDKWHHKVKVKATNHVYLASPKATHWLQGTKSSLKLWLLTKKLMG